MTGIEKQFISEHLQDDTARLALHLSAAKTGMDVPLVLRQIAGRQAIRQKLPQWYADDNILYPEHLPLEQCSSALTAAYKSRLLGGVSFADLTGGFGVDCAAISDRFEEVYYVERQAQLCALARHNFAVLGLDRITVVHNEAERYLQQMHPVDCIYLDPARRGKRGNKVAGLADCEPDILRLKTLLTEKAPVTLLKLSPMLDITMALRDLPETSEVHVLSVDNDCKELLFLLKRENAEEPLIHCVNLGKKPGQAAFTFRRSEEQALPPDGTSSLGEYLYEPNVSLLKAGAYKVLSRFFDVYKLHRDSHLYTSDRLIPDFPGRVFRVECVFPLNRQELKVHLQGISRAHITVRNFPSSVDDLRKKLKISPGGSVYLFATTLGDGRKVIIKSA
ncbi:MAG: class I SAM-dependent methyltransferase [Dysgonamonadaceae bacterium]|jgi:hypothetical protein|nr:class I SAM-dependent methyltransferase [Dysgonamonadaceae bacterium]